MDQALFSSTRCGPGTQMTLPSVLPPVSHRQNASQTGPRSPGRANGGDGGRASLPSAVSWIIGFGLSVPTKLPFRENCRVQRLTMAGASERLHMSA